MKTKIIVLAGMLAAAGTAQATDAIEYATIIKSHIKGTVSCSQFAGMIERIAYGGMPDSIKIRQIDKVLDAADRGRCVEY